MPPSHRFVEMNLAIVRHQEGSTTACLITSPERKYRQAKFGVLDYVCGEIDRRFIQSDLSVVYQVELLLVLPSNGNVPEVVESVAKYMEGKIDISHLRVQLQMLPDAIKAVSAISK